MLLQQQAGALRAQVVANHSHADTSSHVVGASREPAGLALTSITAMIQHATGDATVTFSAMLAEYVAMTLFVVIGCGSAMSIAKEPGSAWILQVSLSFGFAISSLAYAVASYSGGQINCAVTLGLMLVQKIGVVQGILNVFAQLCGSVTGAYILTAIFPRDMDKTGGLGCNKIAEGFSPANAFVGEAMMTFLLMFVVLETAVNPNSEENRALACLAIGFAVFLAHTVLIPIDGCSINPTRSFGPAFVVQQLSAAEAPDRTGRAIKVDAFKDMHVFWAGPCVGSTLAAIAYGLLRVS